MQTGLSYNDILLKPKYSEISSRNNGEISTNTWLTKNTRLDLPILSSNMETVTGWNMLATLSNLGGFGVLHRFDPLENTERIVRNLIDKEHDFGYSVGVNDFERIDLIKDILPYSELFPPIFIDVAHGHHSKMRNTISYIREVLGEDVSIIAGNIATAQGAFDLAHWGADAVKVNVGSGSACTTRIQTGVGIPTVTALTEVVKALDSEFPDVKIIADGGIQNSGDIAKALALGADTVMIGRLLAATSASPTKQIIGDDGYLYKEYRGSASFESKRQRGESRNIEGVSKLIPYTGDTVDVIESLMDGVRSSMSYLNANNLEEFRANAEFIQITPAGYYESTPFMLQ